MKKYKSEDVFKIILDHKTREYDYHKWTDIFRKNGIDLNEHNVFRYLEKLVNVKLLEKTTDLKYKYHNYIFDKQIDICRAMRDRDKNRELLLKIEYLKLILDSVKAYSPSAYFKLEKLARMGIQNFLEVDAI